MLTDNVNDIWLEVGGWGMGAEEGRYEHNSALVLLSPLGTVVWTLSLIHISEPTRLA